MQFLDEDGVRILQRKIGSSLTSHTISVSLFEVGPSRGPEPSSGSFATAVLGRPLSLERCWHDTEDLAEESVLAKVRNTVMMMSPVQLKDSWP